ncbi:MAG: hypothetical protein L6256_09025, partial [Propionicimonas sp.]|nr:hypothetical protein [Propionicimonas sp.]
MLGRFITVDPVQSVDDPLQWNPYLYANNSPVTASDPSGLIMMTPDRGGGSSTPTPKRGVGHITKPKTQTNKSPRQSGGRTAPVQHGPSAPNLPGNFFAGAGWGL